MASGLGSAERRRHVRRRSRGRPVRGGGYETFVDGVIGPWFLDAFAAPAEEHGLALDYVVLRPTEDVAVQRAAARGDAGLTDEGPLRQLHREFADLGELERHVVDTSALSPEESADAVEAGLREGRFVIR